MQSTAVTHEVHKHVEIPWRMHDRRGDSKLCRKVAMKVHDGHVILVQEIDLVWRQVCAQVGICEERREHIVERPVCVLVAVEAVRIVGAFVAQDSRCVHHHLLQNQH